MAKSPSAVAAKWTRNLSSATQAIREGVEGVTESPTKKAAARADAYRQGVDRAVSEGRWQKGLQRVTLEDWKRDMLDKGVGRVASGAAAAEGKMSEFLGEFLPHVEAGQRKLDSMPRGNLDQNIQRMVEMARHNASFRRRG